MASAEKLITVEESDEEMNEETFKDTEDKRFDELLRRSNEENKSEFVIVESEMGQSPK